MQPGGSGEEADVPDLWLPSLWRRVLKIQLFVCLFFNATILQQLFMIRGNLYRESENICFSKTLFYLLFFWVFLNRQCFHFS